MKACMKSPNRLASPARLKAAARAAAALAILLPASARADSATSATSAGMVLQAVFGLAVVLGVMLVALWLVKRMGLARPMAGQPVKIVGGVSVGNRERVMVVEVAGQWLVVGVAQGSVNLLANLPAQEIATPTQNGPVPPAFANWLKATMDKRNAK